ncbi:hypothetical protein PAXINDRAFT_169629 [Paxillus involutus ATCC 200175]|uniref:Uncharacterized protein n=1 Tax=Paxillus involutus ATCC 200175 TaxID=664439 RepID=A0A0C9U5P4_PAXIN|nr:hypothetical protein PAXINDRAFT_169629 [Paxillus involutus ATCC 200175]
MGLPPSPNLVPALTFQVATHKATHDAGILIARRNERGSLDTKGPSVTRPATDDPVN